MHERPVRPAVSGAVEAPLRRARDQRPVLGDPAIAAHGRVSAHGERGARVDRVRIARLDPDRADTAGIERRGAVRAGPVVAAVGRLVEPDACDTAAPARVALARSDPERVRAWIVRVDRDRAGRVDPEAACQVLPLRFRRERVLRAPDAAARRSDPHPALRGPATRVIHPAVRVDRQIGRPPGHRELGWHVRARCAERRGLVQRRLRPDLLPRCLVRSRNRAGCPHSCRLEGSACCLQAGQRDVLLRIRHLGELLQAGRRAAGGVSGRFPGRLTSVARNRLAELRQVLRQSDRHVPVATSGSDHGSRAPIRGPARGEDSTDGYEPNCGQR